MTYEELKKANELIKTTDIKGKDYAEVNQRIKAFRSVYPEGFIKTTLVSDDSDRCIFYAESGYYDNGNPIVLGTGTAFEMRDSTFINKTSYIENCETSAIGRCLGSIGFGIDTSIASSEEVQNAMLNQANPKFVEDPKPKKKKEDPKPKAMSYEEALEYRIGSRSVKEIFQEKQTKRYFEMADDEGKDAINIVTREIKKINASKKETED